jgi:hypothetical protein
MSAVSAVAGPPTTIWYKDEPLAPLRPSIPEWRSVVMAAYTRQPTLSLTMPQGQRLWSMDSSTCGYVLDSLVSAGMLSRTSAGQYCRADYIGPLDPVFSI